jgi:hypothetical protein
VHCSVGASANQPGNVIADMLALFQKELKARDADANSSSVARQLD